MKRAFRRRHNTMRMGVSSSNAAPPTAINSFNADPISSKSKPKDIAQLTDIEFDLAEPGHIFDKPHFSLAEVNTPQQSFNVNISVQKGKGFGRNKGHSRRANSVCRRNAEKAQFSKTLTSRVTKPTDSYKVISSQKSSAEGPAWRQYREGIR